MRHLLPLINISCSIVFQESLTCVLSRVAPSPRTPDLLIWVTSMAVSCDQRWSVSLWRSLGLTPGPLLSPTHSSMPSSSQTPWRSTFAARYKLLSNPSHSVVQQIESNGKKSFKSNRKEPFWHFHDNSSQKGEGETQENFPNKSRNTPSNFCNLYTQPGF